jgi:hypothetical protein
MSRLKSLCVILAAAWLGLEMSSASGLAVQASGLRSARLTEDGLGPVRIGMTVRQASKALGRPLKPAAEPDEDERHCYYVYPDVSDDALGFMVSEDRIARVDVYKPGIRTATGVGVGTSEAEVIRRYGGKVRIEPHFYTGPEGHYLIVEPRRGTQILFETDGKCVTQYRAGKLPEVEYVERCL